MRRHRVTYRPEAIADLDQIFHYIRDASSSVRTARNFVVRIRARCEKIGDVPNGGRQRDDLFPGLRLVPFEHSAVIAYLVEGDTVAITNVFYGGRDYEVLYHPDDAR